MDEAATLLARMRELQPEVSLHGPMTAVAKRQLEAASGCPMPPSHRAFPARFGGGSILNLKVPGLRPHRLGGDHPVIDHMPFRKTPFHETKPSCGAWLIQGLQAMVDGWVEDL